MSDREPESGHSPRLLRALIWAGVGLAPVAALVVLVGGNGPERLAIVLVAVCVVLLGASLLIRNDPVLLRMHVEDRVAEEIGVLREQLRGELAAARAAAPAEAGPVPHIVPQLPPRAASSASVPHAASSVPRPVRDPFAEPVRGGHDSGRVGVAAMAASEHRASAHVASSPGWPDQNPPDTRRTAGRPGPRPHPGSGSAAVPSTGDRGSAVAGSGHAAPSSGGRASVVAAPGPAAGGAAVPGQRGKATGSVRPPVASAIPVFRPPMPASPAPRLVTGETYGSPRRSAEERTYGRPVAEQTGRRRADETAIDIGYTGRRSKPDHAADESAFAGWADDAGWADRELHHEAESAGWAEGEPGTGWEHGPGRPDAGWGRGGWRDDGAGWAEADPAPGYPGWTEADERRGRNRSAGW